MNCVIINYRTKTQKDRYIKELFDYIFYISKIVKIFLILKLTINETHTYFNLFIIIFINNQTIIRSIVDLKYKLKQFALNWIFEKTRQFNIKIFIH